MTPTETADRLRNIIDALERLPDDLYISHVIAGHGDSINLHGHAAHPLMADAAVTPSDSTSGYVTLTTPLAPGLELREGTVAVRLLTDAQRARMVEQLQTARIAAIDAALAKLEGK